MIYVRFLVKMGGTLKQKRTKEDTTKRTAQQCIEAILGEKAPVCVKWAEENHQLLIRPQTPERSEKDAQHIIEKWQTRTAAKEAWLAKIGEEPGPLEKDDVVTIGELHTYLTSLLALHPDVADVPIRHEECCGDVETCYAEFDLEKEYLRIC